MALRPQRKNERRSERITVACTRQEKKDARFLAKWLRSNESRLFRGALRRISAEARRLRDEKAATA